LLLLLLQPLAFLLLLRAQLLLLLLLLFIQVGVRGLRRCCSGGWRLIVGVNGCSCGAIVTHRWRGIVLIPIFGGQRVVPFFSASCPS
jgi:hypothetical protein